MACNCTDSNEINTPSCTAGCAQSIAPCRNLRVGCGTVPCSCGCGSCQCQAAGTASPVPFYNQAGSSQEVHAVPVTYQIYVTALSVSSSFVMPSCNGEAVISFQGLVQLQVGAYLWSAVHGYLLVTAFDSLTGDVTVENECLSGNSAPGTVVPACTLFNVTVPPCDNPCVT